MPLPVPEPGLVIPYAYLWRDEAMAGRESGRKVRPSVLVFMRRSADEQSIKLSVAPITHLAPADPRLGMEIPAAIKRHLRLDGDRSWLVLNELNQFHWPGFDLAQIPGRPGEFAYGLLPPRFFDAVVARVRAFARTGGIAVTDRD